MQKDIICATAWKIVKLLSFKYIHAAHSSGFPQFPVFQVVIQVFLTLTLPYRLWSIFYILSLQPVRQCMKVFFNSSQPSVQLDERLA